MSALFWPKIFIAYSHDDFEFVKMLARRLESNGFDPVWDRHIMGGEEWRLRLEEWISHCDGAIVVLSPQSAASEHFAKELEALDKRRRQAGLRVVPVLYKGDISDWPDSVSSIQHVDFREPSGKTQGKMFVQLAASLREGPTTKQRWWRPQVHRWGLPQLFLAALSPVLIAPIGRAVVLKLGEDDRLERLHAVQRSVEDLDVVVRGLAGSVAPTPDGEREYRDPSSGDHLATDVWSDRRLTWRMFFRDGRLIARDRFDYSGETVVGKTRTHLDTEQRPFITDHYAQNGVLIEKMDCPGGVPASCVARIDFLPSPLPPPGLIFYR